MSSGDISSAAVCGEVVEAIESWDPVSGPVRWSDERFDDLARRVFRFQFEHNEPYRRFCERREVTPSDVDSHGDIPAVATEVFKHVDIGSTSEPVRVFRTSGTTTGTRGRHPFGTLEVYRASLHPAFVRFCNPDRSPFRMLVCAPPPGDLPDSSLSFMLGELVDRWGDDESRFFAGGPDSEAPTDMTFDFEAFAAALDRAEREGAATMVLGTAYGFAEFFECVAESWDLPEGSRLMETGGFKGESGEVTKDGLYEAFSDRFGLDIGSCVAEYSMTELSSQAYTPNLGRNTRRPPSERAFVGPPWTRIEVVDPATLEVREDPGSRGLIRWYDLANVGSVCAVQTSDLGAVDSEVECGVVHLGRTESASLRGCSLTAEEIAADSEH